MQELKALQMEKAEIEKEIKQLDNRQKILLNRKHKEERNPSLGYKGALIHPKGCCALCRGHCELRSRLGATLPNKQSKHTSGGRSGE